MHLVKIIQGRAHKVPSWRVADYLHQFVLTFSGLPLEFLSGKPGLSQLGFVEIAASPGGHEVLFQLTHHQPHLFHLSLVLLKGGQRTEVKPGAPQQRVGSETDVDQPQGKVYVGRNVSKDRWADRERCEWNDLETGKTGGVGGRRRRKEY